MLPLNYVPGSVVPHSQGRIILMLRLNIIKRYTQSYSTTHSYNMTPHNFNYSVYICKVDPYLQSHTTKFPQNSTNSIISEHRNTACIIVYVRLFLGVCNHLCNN